LKTKITYVSEQNAGNTFKQIPKWLDYIIITNDGDHVCAVQISIALVMVMDEAVKTLDNSTKVEAFLNRVDAALALGRAIQVVQTFKDDAEASGDEQDFLSRLSQTHAVGPHAGACCSFPDASVREHWSGISWNGCSHPRASSGGAASGDPGLSVANGIVKMILGSTVPVVVICVLATDESTERVRNGWPGDDSDGSDFVLPQHGERHHEAARRVFGNTEDVKSEICHEQSRGNKLAQARHGSPYSA
jgi:hypothetical protein